MDGRENRWKNPDPVSGDLPETLLYRFEARLELIPIGVVPEGLRMTVPFEGTITEGSLSGARVWGADHLLIRPDGAGVVDAQKTISGEGFHIYEHVRGYCLPPDGVEMPQLERLLDQEFRWPNAPFPIRGISTFRAGTEAHAFLNRELARVDGWADFDTGTLAVEASLLPHRREVAPPGKALVARL